MFILAVYNRRVTICMVEACLVSAAKRTLFPMYWFRAISNLLADILLFDVLSSYTSGFYLNTDTTREP